MKKLIGIVALLISGSISAQTTSEIYQTKDGAINGYDAVAYFTQNKAVKSEKQFAVVYKNATWYFSTNENKEAFKKDPVKYAPQYGGYCAYGCCRGYKAKTEADDFTIVDGKLYLNYNLDVRKLWNKDQAGFIKKANDNWPKVKQENFDE